MNTNFTVNDGKISTLDKIIIVYNFNGLNEIFNQGFCFKKSKIKRCKEIAGIWKIKPKN